MACYRGEVFTRHFWLCELFPLTLRPNLKGIFTNLQQTNFKIGCFILRSLTPELLCHSQDFLTATRPLLLLFAKLICRGVAVGPHHPFRNPGLVHTPFHSLHYQVQEHFNCLAYVCPSGGTSFKVGDSIFLCKSSGFLLFYYSLVFQITLISTEHYIWVFTICMHL